MAVLPREQLVQRHDACVSAPGVVLWASTTNLTTCEVNNTDLVTEGEAEEAMMAPPEWFSWDVVVGPGDNLNFGEGEFGVDLYDAPDILDPDGVYQNTVFDGVDFGEGPFGGVETDWYIPHGSTYWGEGADSDEYGVYP